jgi:hypothetical protein
MAIATVLHTTMTKSRKKLIMAAIKQHALMAWAFANNRVEWEDGGHEITNPLVVGRNPNVTSYSYYEELPVAQTNEFETVKYTWSRVGTIGNLDRGANPQWRTSSYDFDGTLDETNVEEAMDDILMDVSVKGEKPDLILFGRNLYRTYRAAVRDKVVVNLSELGKGKGMVDLGFSGVSHQTIPIVYDEDCPVNKAYFINSKYLRLHILRHVNMRVKELTAPWNMDATGRRIVWQGQWCSWKNYRTHAVLINE